MGALKVRAPRGEARDRVEKLRGMPPLGCAGDEDRPGVESGIAPKIPRRNRPEIPAKPLLLSRIAGRGGGGGSRALGLGQLLPVCDFGYGPQMMFPAAVASDSAASTIRSRV
jgi:hypothetical protein